MDETPNYPIRDQFSPYGLHKQVVILDPDQTLLGSITLNNGLNNAAQLYIRNIIEQNYQLILPGDINGDESINIQDIVLLVNMILSGNVDESGDVNSDNSVNVLDVVQIVNIILNPN